MFRHAVSADGTRYVFMTGAPSQPPEHLYMRDMSLGASGKTIQLDTGEGVPQAPGVCTKVPTQCERAVFQDASADGSVIFFTDTQRLVAGAGANAERPDLYACQVTESGCHLTDLTPEPKAGESATVQGVTIGESNDGHTVYYVANGGMNGGTSGNCRPGEAGTAKESGEDPEALTSGGVCTLYMSRFDEGSKSWSAPHPITRLSAEDEFDWRPKHSPQPHLACVAERAMARVHVRPQPHRLQHARQDQQPRRRGGLHLQRRGRRRFAAPRATRPAPGPKAVRQRILAAKGSAC